MAKLLTPPFSAPRIEPRTKPAEQARSGEVAGVRGWLVERLGVGSLSYPVPEHANGLLYTLGGISAFVFLVLIVIGIWLAQFYHPHPPARSPRCCYGVRGRS